MKAFYCAIFIDANDEVPMQWDQAKNGGNLLVLHGEQCNIVDLINGANLCITFLEYLIKTGLVCSCWAVILTVCVE